MNRTLGAAALALLVTVAAAFVVSPTSAVGAAEQQEPPPPSQADTPATTTTAPIITTTLPELEGDLGRIIPLPNSGAEPDEPGDRGGWQQLALFVFVCVVIAAMAVFVWWRSRIARARRRVEGHDPVEVARDHGGDVRRPRPPGIVD